MLAEKTYDFPWGPTSRSYNLAVRIIEDDRKGAVPRDRAAQKEYFASLADAFGVNRHTVTNIMHVLKSTKRIHSVTPVAPGSTVPSSQEGLPLQRNDASAHFASPKVPSESTAGPASTVPETAASPKVPEGGETAPQDVPKVPSESPASTASTVLSPEDLSEIKAIVKNLPELIKQGAREYVQGIGGPAATNPEDIEMQANLKIEEGSAVARMVYLTPKTLLYFDFSRGRGFKGNLSEFLNNFVDSWFKRQDIKVGVIERQEFD